MLPINFVQQYQRKFPRSFVVLEQMRLQRQNLGGIALPAWDDSWCFVPLLAARGHVKRQMIQDEGAEPEDRVNVEAIMVQAAVTWHITKGIYQVKGQINPVSYDPGVELKLAHNLPQWCLYVEHQLTIRSSEVQGFFVYADFVPGPDTTRLVFVFLADHEQGTTAIPAMIDCDAHDTATQKLRRDFSIPLELVAKITAKDAIFSGERPKNPQAFLASKRERKYHIASYPTVFEVK